MSSSPSATPASEVHAVPCPQDTSRSAPGGESRGHVAEYFAVLGVGDELVWKHQQKQASGDRTSPSAMDVSHDPSSHTNHWTSENEEDDALLEARFLREIVDVTLRAVPVTSKEEETEARRMGDPAPDEGEAAPPREPMVLRCDDWQVLHRTVAAPRPRLANLAWVQEPGLDRLPHRREEPRQPKPASQSIVRRMESTIRQWRPHTQRPSQLHQDHEPRQEPQTQYYLAYQRRRDLDDLRPAIIGLQLCYVRLHKACLPEQPCNSSRHSSSLVAPHEAEADRTHATRHTIPLVALHDMLPLPDGYHQWVVPEPYESIYDPSRLPRTQGHPRQPHTRTVVVQETRGLLPRQSKFQARMMRREDEEEVHDSESSDMGVEVNIVASQEGLDGGGSSSCDSSVESGDGSHNLWPQVVQPCSLPKAAAAGINRKPNDDEYHLVPIVAVQRQGLDEEERFHETELAIVDLAVSFTDETGTTFQPSDTVSDNVGEEEEDELDSDGIFHVLGKTKWQLAHREGATTASRAVSVPVVMARRNLPFGFADVAFATSVLGRFPSKNYKDFPLPEEELPMFCYPTGCRLHRSRYSDAPLTECYGFVVKNERGDSIYISCVSFMEPLTADKVAQLNEMSKRRSRTSLVHRAYFQRKGGNKTINSDGTGSDASTAVGSDFILTGFDDMTTFEKKTICLVSRFPFWTAFRKFLSNIHILSCSTNSLPLERYISHLLLSVPVPRPGSPSVIVPLPALNVPMVFYMPPLKDFPLVDLPFHRLFACLDVKTVVTIVLGLLTLEHKVIVMSTRPSLVLDVCELLRSLLFPFELCAPSVPRLTEPFKSSLEFPGALFVGIHQDESENGLAEIVRRSPPEDSIIIDLDSGELTGDAGRHQVVSTLWDLIPTAARSMLVSELEALCSDAGIVDGQEPLDSQFDSAFDVGLSAAIDDSAMAVVDDREPLDDRAVRDAFLRFFCYMLSGYERYLIVPDADFLISGDEWFNADGFLEAAPVEKKSYLTALLATQLFQSFIQRRTEASDVQCMLFDECLAEFQSSSIPYGRLGGDVESVSLHDKAQVMFSLLVDQSATLPQTELHALALNRSMDASEADSSFNMSRTSIGDCPYSANSCEWAVTAGGDFVTAPSREGLSATARFSYSLNGNPCFPHTFDSRLFLPLQPDSWVIETAVVPNPLLARTDRELEEGARRRRLATSSRSTRSERRCMWQLPKLMGSHFLGSWLMCIPVQISQPNLSNDQQSRILMRALGALRLLRSRQRIVPDEAAYRALMVACGRTHSDRGPELMRLFGLLRSDGIFPSAVTLGQYTRALAEGYSKRQATSTNDDAFSGIEVTESSSRIGVTAYSQQSNVKPSQDKDIMLTGLDANILNLETHGRRWRQRSSIQQEAKTGEIDMKSSLANKSWLPVVYSASIVPTTSETDSNLSEVRLVAMWSRTRGCSSCTYVPLEEEVMAGWDVVGGENEIPGAVACPRCGSLIVPMLGYKEVTLSQALVRSVSVDENLDCSVADFGALPPQIAPTVNPQSENVQYIAYISPASLRLALEHYVDEYGEEVLIRDNLKALDPEIFYNFWWYCARFSLPLPLPVGSKDGSSPAHYILFAAWDYSVAERGCQSAAKVLRPLLDSSSDQPFDEDLPIDAFDEVPFLSRFNLQGFFSTVWDHIDLSKVLVKLVEACDKKDFKPVAEAILSCNRRRLEQYSPIADDTFSQANSGADGFRASEPRDSSPSIELDLYRTVLYLVKYQCTTAFHSFFPATVKPCKGYHFWCVLGTPLPKFDRMMRDGVKRAIASNKEQGMAPHMQDVSEVALAFRCVFGHLI